jgi:hypothetical protein
MEPIRKPHTAFLRAAGALGVALGCLWVAGGCGKSSTVNAPQVSVVAGRVVEASAPTRGVAGATVKAVGQEATATTDSIGLYSLNVQVVDSGTVQIVVSKTGYDTQVVSAGVGSGGTVVVPDVRLLATAVGGGGSEGPSSGPASNIVMVAVAPQRIGVRHSGDSESAVITFQVRDSRGTRVDLAHRVRVRFVLAETLPDSVFVSPDTATTDTAGKVSVTVTSGTRAQSVMVRAYVEGTAIWSEPVPVAIHAAPPDQLHYSIAPAKVNIPGLVLYNVVDAITAFTGDRYANPVPVGTENYFTTTGGIIAGSAVTDELGRSTVGLISAAPAPAGGLAEVTCQTVDEGGSRIQRSTYVMFSGHTVMNVSPTTFAVGLNQSQDFVVTLRDAENGNPLTGGTQLTVVATLGSLAGDVTVTLPDTQDRVHWTTFHFTLLNPVDGAPVLAGPQGARVRLRPATVAIPGFAEWAAQVAARGAAGPAGAQLFKPAAVRVSVTSPNGDASQTLYGTVEK